MAIFKLLAALGAWLGPLMLPLIYAGSAFVGSVVGVDIDEAIQVSKPFALDPISSLPA